MDQAQDDEAAIARWLVADARLCPDPVALIGGFCARLIGQGVPLWRLRAGQALANPLASAWGVIWTRAGAGTHEYLVPRATLSTGAYYRSPFQHVVERRETFRRRLVDLDPARDHAVLHEMAAAGGTDYLAVPLEYGDGSVQGLSLVSDGPDGFADPHLALIERLRQPLAAALEPMAMRRSTASLLCTFLGDGPAEPSSPARSGAAIAGISKPRSCSATCVASPGLASGWTKGICSQRSTATSRPWSRPYAARAATC